MSLSHLFTGHGSLKRFEYAWTSTPKFPSSRAAITKADWNVCVDSLLGLFSGTFILAYRPHISNWLFSFGAMVGGSIYMTKTFHNTQHSSESSFRIITSILATNPGVLSSCKSRGKTLPPNPRCRTLFFSLKRFALRSLGGRNQHLSTFDDSSMAFSSGLTKSLRGAGKPHGLLRLGGMID